MKEPFIIGDAFAIRGGEQVQLRLDGIQGERIAFMCAPVPPLPSPSKEQSFLGQPVEQFCVVGAELHNGKWQWMQLAPDTKELIGELLFDSGLERGKWYGAIITSTPPPAAGDAIAALIKARDCLHRVCAEQAFELKASIPARPGVDDDLVIGDGIEAGLDALQRPAPAPVHGEREAAVRATISELISATFNAAGWPENSLMREQASGRIQEKREALLALALQPSPPAAVERDIDLRCPACEETMRVEFPSGRVALWTQPDRGLSYGNKKGVFSKATISAVATDRSCEGGHVASKQSSAGGSGMDATSGTPGGPEAHAGVVEDSRTKEVTAAVEREGVVEERRVWLQIRKDDLSAVHAALDEAGAERGDQLAVVDRIASLGRFLADTQTWDGLLQTLDKHWPESFIPTKEDDPERDTGARIVSLLRWVSQLRAEVARHREAWDCLVGMEPGEIGMDYGRGWEGLRMHAQGLRPKKARNIDHARMQERKANG